MNYLSLCDGIGAAHVAWKPLGWNCVGASEIERFPIAVVKERHPEIAELGDMTRYHEWNITAPDLVCGGTPCQSFSVAGLRKGLADPRGNLALVFLGAVDRFRPRWVVWENVPGVLFSGERRDFGAFLGGLGELGYGFAHRVLDAQYFGLAQRRKRVFVVGHLGDWRSAAAVLFEQHSLQGDHPPSRRTGERPAPAISVGASGGGGPRGDFWSGGGLAEVSHTLKAEGFDASEDGTGRGTPLVTSQATVMPNMTTRTGTGTGNSGMDEYVVPVLVRMREGKEGGGKGPLVSSDQSLTLATANDQVLAYGKAVHTTGHQGDRVVAEGDVHPSLSAQGGNNGGGSGALDQRAAMQVRRLTPRECERLQGFPDDYTRIAWRGRSAEDCPDGSRYKALGNSWAVPVVRWIGERINAMEAINQANTPAA